MFSKNILVVAGVFIPEPTVSANLMADLAFDLANRGHNVTVLRPKPTRPLGATIPIMDYSKLPYRVILIDSYTCPRSSFIGRFRESISMGHVVVNYIKKNYKSIDFIYNDPWHLFGVNMVSKIAVKYNIPYITPIQDIYPESLALKFNNRILKALVIKLLFPLDKYSQKHAFKIHTISSKMVDYLSRTRDISSDRYLMIRNWQDESRFMKYRNNHSLNIKGDKQFIFLFLGNLSPVTELDIVLAAFIKANLPNTKFIIAGNGSLKGKLQLMVKENSQINIEFLSAPFDEVPQIQEQADVLVLSLQKGVAGTAVPSKIPAYMFSAKPILASVDLNSDVAQIIKDSKSGWVVEPSSKEAMMKKFVEIVNLDSSILREMGENGFKYGMENFSKNKNLKKLTDACINAIK